MINALLQGENIFLDANIFIYYFAGKSIECANLFAAITQKKVTAYTSPFVLAEVHYKLKKGIGKQEANPKMYESTLAFYLQQIEENLTILEKSWKEYFSEICTIQQQYSLLTNDALHLAAMRLAGITTLISADKDFDQVKEIRRIGPSDI